MRIGTRYWSGESSVLSKQKLISITRETLIEPGVRARDFESHVRTLSILRLNTYETSINKTNAITLLFARKIGKKKKKEGDSNSSKTIK